MSICLQTMLDSIIIVARTREGGEGKEGNRVWDTHHRPNVRVRYRIKLFIPELIIRSDVDVSAPVLR